jgi:hypothetical protein
MPENNIRWHIGHAIDIWTYAAGKTLRYRINLLAFEVACVCAVLEESGKLSTKEGKKTVKGRDVEMVTGMVSLLRSAYFPALETNPYIPHLRANYEMATDILERRVMKIINRENMTSSSMMQEAMTSLGERKRLLKKQGGDAV